MSEVQSRECKVLVVDDEKSICDLLCQYLRKQGYNVFRAASGEEAVRIVEVNGIDLVLSDIKMPGMTGVDLLKWIKEYDRFLPVIITTGFPTLDTAIEALKLGAFDYLTKPFHLEEIGEKVRRALINRQLEEENILFSKLVSLHEVTKVLSSTHIVPDLNKRLLDFSVKLARADGGALMFFDSFSRLYTSETFPADHDPAFWKQEFYTACSQWAAGHEEPLALESGSELSPPGLPKLPEHIQSYIVFPLRTPKRTLGVLNLIRVEGSVSFSNIDLEIINVLASQASISIENARLYHSIRDNYLKTVRGFALAVEAKDQYTHGHSEKVMEFTVVLAEKLGLSAQEIDQIKYAGLLHDIGKIGVSENILNKPGRLTDDEFAEIKKHPDLGARIISDVPFLKSLVPLIRHHHEFFDGSGYPDRIAHDEIPYGARILCVADSFEAMTSNRPYRKAMPRDMASEILTKEKGRQFDPHVVDAFLELLQSGTAGV
ncbi:MAG: response regulator [Chitinivibrionales bacterium]|nr:response regulator [Chitinivibrionales bacterium]MBD3394775.1 response regulator [Chitinivibrionales bacterium]